MQLPDALYSQAKLLAEKREISLAELVRRGIEYMISVSAPAASPDATAWQLPEPMHLGKTDPFDDPDWRVKLYMPEGMVAETRAKYGKPGRPAPRARR